MESSSPPPQLNTAQFYLPGPKDGFTPPPRRRAKVSRQSKDDMEATDEAELVVDSIIFRALADVHPDGSAGSDQEPEEPAPEFAVLPEGKELTQEDIASSLHHLGKSADDTKFTYLKANLQLTNRQALGVSQVAALASYVDLQNVDLSENLLREIDAVQSLQALLHLNASQNGIEHMYTALGESNLLTLNLSRNHMRSTASLASHTRLQHLDLSENGISKLDGLQSCRALRRLHLSFNQVKRFKALSLPCLQHLTLDHNRVVSLKELAQLTSLRTLDLSSNHISSLEGLESLQNLEQLDLKNNRVLDVAETRFIRDHKFLFLLDLTGNPVQEAPDYRLHILFRLNQLMTLDQTQATAEEKVEAINLLDPPPLHTAAVDHAMHKSKAAFNSEFLLASTPTTISAPYPMLILTGPWLEAKEVLRQRLVQQYGDCFTKCLSTTTKARRAGGSKEHQSVSVAQMEEAIQDGQMVQTCRIAGDVYGLSRLAVDKAAEKRRIAVVCAEAEEAVTLQSSLFRTLVVFVPPPPVNDFSPARIQLYRMLLERFDVCLPQADVDTMWEGLQGEPVSTLLDWLAAFNATTVG